MASCTDGIAHALADSRASSQARSHNLNLHLR
jgi:hypothetical protein